MAQLDPNRYRPVPRGQVYMAFASLAMVAVCGLWTWNIGTKANLMDHALFHLHEDLEGLRPVVAQMGAHKK
ncbi:MAG TPA: hypothetical protein VGS41_12435 [Chthonomonadales bacterium]|nr:hypothetical protein [Chthonomonadales bacterium]